MRKLYVRLVRRVWAGALAIGVLSIGALAVAQGINGVREGFWGPRYSSRAAEGGEEDGAPLTARTGGRGALAIARALRRSRPVPADARDRLVRWNQIAIDASGVDHAPVEDGESRIFGEQLGPGRASRAMAIVHIAIADAVNAFYGRWDMFSRLDPAPRGASVEAALVQAAHDSLVAMYPSQAPTFDEALAEDLAQIDARGKKREAASAVGPQP